MKLRFVATQGGNYHMTELLAGLSSAARDAGLDAELQWSEFPAPDGGTVYVFVPHEHAAFQRQNRWPSPLQRARTIALCVENPDTGWFNHVAQLAPQFPLTMAINRASVRTLRARGVRSEHLQLGYTPDWDRWRGEPCERPVDIAYLGAEDPRRDRLIAGFSRWWSHRRTAILVPTLDVKPGAQADYLVDEAKYDLLTRSKVLVNLHRERTSSFEWVRILQAIANGCVVVSEHSRDHAPLVAGEHFVAADPSSIPHLVEGLLRAPERLAAIRDRAYGMVRSQLSMSSAIERLAVAAEELAQHGGGGSSAPEPASTAEQNDHASPARRARTAPIRGAVRNVTSQPPELVDATPAYRDAVPRVSVTIPLHNCAREAVAALGSVDCCEFEDYEVLVLDGASTDGSLDAVTGFLLERPWMPAAVFSQRVNRGLGAGRNALARLARGELMFVLDADHEIYPRALGALVDALDQDPGAAFAYPLIAAEEDGEPAGLLSRYAWDTARLRAGNYIETMAMLRLADWGAVGGYPEDVRPTGSEHFHLWRAYADTHRHGTLVPEVLACVQARPPR